MEPSNFHSTVLQRPRDDEEERERRRRDILNPAGAGVAAPAPAPATAPASRHSTFSLRSPPRTEFHHPPPNYSSPSAPASGPGSHQSPRQVLHNPFMSSSAPPPPPLPHAAGASSTSSGHLQGPPHSPLQLPSGYYPPPKQQEMHQARDKPATGNFYDPLTDSAKDRNISDASSWQNTAKPATPKVSSKPAHIALSQTQWRGHNGHRREWPSVTTRKNFSVISHKLPTLCPTLPQTTDHQFPPQARDSYYPQAPADKPYYNGNYSSPVATTFPPRSPLSHPHPAPVESISPPSRPTRMSSPGLRHAASPSLRPSNGVAPPPTSLANLMQPESATPSPLKAPMTVSASSPDILLFQQLTPPTDSQPLRRPHELLKHPLER